MSILLIFFACDNSFWKKDPEENMIYFKGGNFHVGCLDTKDCRENEIPAFEIEIKPFYLDVHPVTVSEFRNFIQQTNYVTSADEFGDAGVYDFDSLKWKLLKGANWEFPQGRNASKAKDDHPVTQVSWIDAKKYCECFGKRLPSEIEWEYAAKGGRDEQIKYSWGEKLVEGHSFKANVWQGSFPSKNSMADGFFLTSPVGYFGKTSAGLLDMGGNVWQWCEDEYLLYPNNTSFIEKDPNNRVIRGGSFMCDSNVCFSYRVTARSYCSKETSLMHQGFRCAK